MSLKRRIGALEQAPALRGATNLQAAIDMTAAQNARAIKRRCQLLLTVTEDAAQREALHKTIAEIDAGTFRDPAPLPTNLDDRAKEVRARMIAAGL